MAAEAPSPSSRLEIAKCAPPPMILRHSTERRSCGAGYASPVPRVDGFPQLENPESDRHAVASANAWTADAARPRGRADRLSGARPRGNPRPARREAADRDRRRVAESRAAVARRAASTCRPSATTSCPSTRPRTRSPGCAATRRSPRPSPRPGRSTSSTSSGSRRRARSTPARRSRSGPSCLWLQLGIASREAGRIAHEGGLAVVMNRCLAIEAARRRDRGRVPARRTRPASPDRRPDPERPA